MQFDHPSQFHGKIPRVTAASRRFMQTLVAPREYLARPFDEYPGTNLFDHLELLKSLVWGFERSDAVSHCSLSENPFPPDILGVFHPGLVTIKIYWRGGETWIAWIHFDITRAMSSNAIKAIEAHLARRNLKLVIVDQQLIKRLQLLRAETELESPRVEPQIWLRQEHSDARAHHRRLQSRLASIFRAMRNEIDKPAIADPQIELPLQAARPRPPFDQHTVRRGKPCPAKKSFGCVDLRPARCRILQ